MVKQDLLSMTVEEIEAIMQGFGEAAYRAKQLWGWLHLRHVTSFFQMQNIPKKLIEKLDAEYFIATAIANTTQVSKKDGTVKYLFAMHDGAFIEAVAMQYNHGNTVCISTQVGCRMACSFCASAEGGLVRNLTAGEMCAQVYAAQQDGQRISGVVLMGCGEPLDNLPQTLRFIELITHKDGANIGARHITISTCGLVPQMQELAAQKLQVTLAVSLHAASDSVRQELMPIAKSYPLHMLIAACKEYVQLTGRRITFEYALVSGLNDTPAHAQGLAKLIRGINCHVNLIPINKARGSYQPTTRKNAENFATMLQAAHIPTTIRRSLGGDVDAACGQLRARQRTL